MLIKPIIDNMLSFTFHSLVIQANTAMHGKGSLDFMCILHPTELCLAMAIFQGTEVIKLTK